MPDLGAGATLTTQRLNRSLLHRQLLLERERVSAAEAVGRLLAVQAQDPASPYLALWNRVAGFQASELDTLFQQREVVRSTLLRMTLHASRANDYPFLRGAILGRLRDSYRTDQPFTGTELTESDLEALLPEVLAGLGDGSTREEIEAMLAARLGFHHDGVARALRRLAPLWHAPSGAPWFFGRRAAYVAAPAYEPPAAACTSDLVLRYLAAAGPASIRDVVQFTGLTSKIVRAAVTELAGDLVRLGGPGGEELLDLAGATLPDADASAPARLLPMWDNALLAHADRGRIIPPEYRRAVIRVNGDVLPAILVDGFVAGVWRALATGIEVAAFHQLPRHSWDELSGEAAALRGFLANRDPAVFGRHTHWWSALPAAEVRLLA